MQFMLILVLGRLNHNDFWRQIERLPWGKWKVFWCMLAMQRWDIPPGGGVFHSNIVNPTKAVLHFVCHQKLAFSKFRKWWTFSFKLVYGASSEATPSAFCCSAAVPGGRERERERERGREMDCSFDRIWLGRFYFWCSGTEQLLLWCQWEASWIHIKSAGNHFD